MFRAYVTLINEIKPAGKCSHLPGSVNNAVRQMFGPVSTLRDLEPIYTKYSEGDILIVGAVYDIHTGKVNF
jgi:carbonic anhydrase